MRGRAAVEQRRGSRRRASVESRRDTAAQRGVGEGEGEGEGEGKHRFDVAGSRASLERGRGKLSERQLRHGG